MRENFLCSVAVNMQNLNYLQYNSMQRLFIAMALSLCLVACNVVASKKDDPKNDPKTSADTVEMQQSDTATNPLGTFALSNIDGSKILEYVSSFQESDLQNITQAIYNSRAYSVKYVGNQDGDPEKDNHNQNASNFNNIKGFVFENLEGEQPSIADKTFYLCNDDFLKVNTLTPFEYIDNQPDAQLIGKFEEKFGRKVTRSSIMVSFGNEGENKLCAAQFEHQKDSALAIYALCTADGAISYLEFPAELIDEYSVWRVDDEGEFKMDSNVVNSIFQTNDGYVFLIDDVGMEGVNSYFVRQKADKLVRDEELFSRYTGAF